MTLPPLPDPDTHCLDDDTGLDVWSHSPKQMATFALGRPLTFADRASVDRLTADLRKEGDGLATLVRLLVTNELFLSK